MQPPQLAGQAMAQCRWQVNDMHCATVPSIPAQAAIEQLQEELAGARQEADKWRRVGWCLCCGTPAWCGPLLPPQHCTCTCTTRLLPHSWSQAADRQGGELADAQRHAAALEAELEAKAHEGSALLADTLELKASRRGFCSSSGTCVIKGA